MSLKSSSSKTNYLDLYACLYVDGGSQVNRSDILECYSNTNDVCFGAECPTIQCDPYGDSCVIQEVTDKESSAKTLSYGCAVKPESLLR